MDQVFCSEPQLVGDEKWVLEEIEQELATISRHCPRGEKTFDRLLQLLGELVVSLSRAADARSGSTVPDTDETDRLTQLVQRLEHDVEESKRQIRQLREQVREAEEENLKLLADKSEWDRLIKSQRRQIETLQNQNNEQIIQLTGKLESEQNKSQKLHDAVITLQHQLKSAGRCKERKELKCLAEEMSEIRVDAGTQIMPADWFDAQQTTKREKRSEMQVVHMGNECIAVVEKWPALFSQLHYSRFFLFLLICASQQLYSLQPILCDDLFSFPSEKPPL